MEPLNLDVRVIEPRLKHATIFETFDNLELGTFFIIINDHDPMPLYYQFLAERPNQFAWEYLENGPYEWRVKIEKPKVQAKEKSIGKIAAEDYRKALVFKKFGLDFCCGGKKTLVEAAKEKGIDKEIIQKELDELETQVNDYGQDFSKWEISELIDYIVAKHHQYVKDRTPEIVAILTKVVNVHSAAHPELMDLYQNFSWLDQELFNHMKKEEEILFPYIKDLASVSRKEVPENAALKSTIRFMESEHESVAQILENMKKITDDYQVPAGACGSYKMLYGLLNEFDDDLRRHVHLENNILFPKAILLEEKILEVNA